MKREENKGQFYLIAAVIIIVVLIGFFAVSNMAVTRPSENKVYELSKELNIEGEQVINYGVFNQKNLTSLLDEFTLQYGKYIKEDSNVYFTYLSEDRSKLIITSYERVDIGSVYLNIGGAQVPIRVETRDTPFRVSQEIEQGQTNFNINVGGIMYSFKLNEGENFFFVIQAPKIK